MPPRFRTRASAGLVPATPERLFDDLPRERGGPDALWSHQADVLRSYYARHLDTADLALELPTGSGKTLPGLLIAEWRRRKYGHRVLYACPTQQLARQTAETARKTGIEALVLVGPHRRWSTPDKFSYEGARAIAITTYSTVFNAQPALEAAQTLLFDDAHAAEQFVAGSWSVQIERAKRPALYQEVLGVLRPGLSGVAYQAYRDNTETRRHVQMIGVGHVREQALRLQEALLGLGKDDALFWGATALGDRMDRAQVYVASDAILIRPFIPPTSGHRHYTEARQRIYLSATLGDGGELERSFGRSPIVRLPVPDGWDTRGAGRRFFVFPDLQTGVPARELAGSVVAEAGKALVLAPSAKRATAARDLVPVTGTALGPDGAIEGLLDTFRTAAGGVLLLAARYDGLDLPQSQCRMTVLDGMPAGTHLQEQFLSDTLLAGRVLRERIRTRIIQGAGRCTRGLSDHSVVVILGDELTRFLGKPENRSSLRPELQAEIDFGIDNSTVSEADLLAYVRSFLAQDHEWVTQAEPAVLELRREAQRVRPPENAQLAASAPREVQASAALWSGDWATASRIALDAAAEITAADLAGYRALWTYFGAAWLLELARERGDDVQRRSGQELLRKAYTAARGTAWLRQAEPLAAGDRILDDLDEAAVARAAARGPRRQAAGAWGARHAQLIAGLSQADPVPYETALADLGTLLGAEACKPAGEGRTDSAWVWAGRWWLAVEAKSQQHSEGPVSLSVVRQANDALKTLSHDRGEPVPAGSAILIVSPRQLADPTAAVVAEPFVYMTTPDTLLAFARDAVSAWKQIRAQANGLSEQEALDLTRQAFSEHAILPSDIHARLLRDAVQG